MCISYAQNFEDVILNRIFSGVENGFYIDLGAQHPIVHSCTKLFNDRGWSGVNIEPIEEYFSLLKLDRVRDINLQVLLRSSCGSSTFYEVTDSGLSTQFANIAREHGIIGHSVIQSTREVDTLKNVCEKYANKTIHFLKIDVEGAEKNVLEGADFSVFRPWVVVVEATLPLTQLEVYETWEPLLLNNSYHHVYSDGLNRWYLADKKMSLASFFKYPPNVFDSFELEATFSLRENLEKLTQESIKRASDLKSIQDSRSWRYTKYFRNLVGFVGKLRMPTHSG